MVSGYLLSASVLTPILGRLGDMVGKRRTLLVVLAVLALGTLVAAVAPNIGVLIVARVLQGAGGAILPLSIGIARDELPGERVSVTIGLLSALFGIGGGLGIVLAGPIVDHLGWRWLFWLPFAFVVGALIGVLVGVPESPVRTPGRLDLTGAALLAAALMSLLLAITKGSQWGWSSPATVILFVLGAAVLAVLVLVELRVREPLVNMRLMVLRGVWTTNLAGLLFGFAMFGTFLLIPMLLELPSATGYGFGKSVSQAGLLLLPMAGAMLVSGIASGMLNRRFGPKIPLSLGALFLAVGFAAAAIAHASTGQLLVAVIAAGAGVGLAFAAMSNAIIESVPATPHRRSHERQRHHADHRYRGRRGCAGREHHAPGPARRIGVHHRLLGLRGRRRFVHRGGPRAADHPRPPRRPCPRRRPGAATGAVRCARVAAAGGHYWAGIGFEGKADLYAVRSTLA